MDHSAQPQSTPSLVWGHRRALGCGLYTNLVHCAETLEDPKSIQAKSETRESYEDPGPVSHLDTCCQ